jgi:tetratricopeptide (TPR) repeat protein
MAISKFDLRSYESILGSGKEKSEKLLFMVNTAEAAERYEDMCKLMRMLIVHREQQGEPLTVQERNFFSVAFKNTIGSRRASWRTLQAEDQANSSSLLHEYKKTLEDELENICKDVLSLLKEYLIVEADSGNSGQEAQVFYNKMAGDYYRYLAECIPNDENENSAITYYEKAFKIAADTLNPTHPIRLGLALNYSVCMYEIKKDRKVACTLAKAAFDDAIEKLDKLEESDYKDSTLIMQLLRDNLTLWTSSTDGEEDEN